jgi:DNA-binding transcriptional LysR family regulator
MLLAGLGWGSMPAHLVEDDIARGRLKVVQPAAFDVRTSRLVMGGAYRTDTRLGPAAQWMLEHLSVEMKP